MVTPQLLTANTLDRTINSSLVSPRPRPVLATLSDRDFERQSTARPRREGTLPVGHPFPASCLLLEAAPLHRTFPFGARSLDTRYCYSPSAAEVPDDDVVVDADTGIVAAAVAAVVAVAAAVAAVAAVAAAASAAAAKDTRTTSTEAPSTSSTSPPSAATARRKPKTKEVAVVQARLAVVDTGVPLLLLPLSSSLKAEEASSFLLLLVDHTAAYSAAVVVVVVVASSSSVVAVVAVVAAAAAVEHHRILLLPRGSSEAYSHSRRS